MKTTAIATKQQGGLSQLFEANKHQIARALPKHLSVDRMIRIAFSVYRKNDRLKQCDPGSMVSATIEAAELGLEPTGILGHAYFVPYQNKGRMECQLQIGYRGFLELAYRSGKVKRVQVEVVYDCDEFDYCQGLEPRLIHRKNLMRPSDAKMIASYAIAEMNDGAPLFVVLSKDDIDKRRSASKSGGSGPWVTHYDEMSKKSAIRALAKYLPLSPELTAAAVNDEYREAGVDVSDYVDVDSETPEPVVVPDPEVAA